MRKLFLAAAVVSALGAAYAPVASAADAGDIAAGALVGGVLGYAIGQSNQPYSGYGYATPYYGYQYGYSAPSYGYGYAPGYGSYYGYENTYGVSCNGLPGSRPVVDQWGRSLGVMCPNGTIQYY
jgi:hypothetical protein